MKHKREIPLALARKIIRAYDRVPAYREQQIDLIHLRGYNSLYRRPLDECSDNQLYTVSERILNACYLRAHGCSLLQGSLSELCQQNYEEQLYRTFNTSPDINDPNYVSPEELEHLLLK